jgi:hypothetical protein
MRCAASKIEISPTHLRQRNVSSIVLHFQFSTVYSHSWSPSLWLTPRFDVDFFSEMLLRLSGSRSYRLHRSTGFQFATIISAQNATRTSGHSVAENFLGLLAMSVMWIYLKGRQQGVQYVNLWPSSGHHLVIPKSIRN